MLQYLMFMCILVDVSSLVSAISIATEFLSVVLYAINNLGLGKKKKKKSSEKTPFEEICCEVLL